MINLKYRRLASLALIFTILFVGVIIYLSNTRTILKFLYPLKYEEQVYKYADEFGLDPLLVFSIMKAESNFDNYAISQKGAKGLMQVTDKTGSWAADMLGMKDFSSANLYDPDTNIRIGCWYLGRLKKEFDGDIILAITAYNGGSGRVQEWLKDKELSSTGKSLEKIPFSETDNYVKKVIKEYKVIRYIYGQDT